LIQGGTLQVSGLVFPMGTQPLLVEILNASGNPIGPSRLVNPDELVEEHYFSFATDIPYSLAKGEWVLVVISERDSRIPGIISLTSVEVFASP
jgi:hypothetical protein